MSEQDPRDWLLGKLLTDNKEKNMATPISNRYSYPITQAVDKRFRDSGLLSICYPIGLYAYFADQILSFGIRPEVLIEEIKNKQIRTGPDQTLTICNEPLDVAIDALVNNNFWMFFGVELLDGKVYDADTFFLFMQTKSPLAMHLGLIDLPKGKTFNPPEGGEDIRTVNLDD